MLNLSKGQVLRVKNESFCRTVKIIADGGAMLDKSWYTDAEIEEYFELPEVKWVPKMGQSYWFVVSDIEAKNARWDNDIVDKEHLEAGDCFPSKEAAEAAALKIKELLKSL